MYVFGFQKIFVCCCLAPLGKNPPEELVLDIRAKYSYSFVTCDRLALIFVWRVPFCSIWTTFWGGALAQMLHGVLSPPPLLGNHMGVNQAIER